MDNFATLLLKIFSLLKLRYLSFNFSKNVSSKLVTDAIVAQQDLATLLCSLEPGSPASDLAILFGHPRLQTLWLRCRDFSHALDFKKPSPITRLIVDVISSIRFDDLICMLKAPIRLQKLHIRFRDSAYLQSVSNWGSQEIRTALESHCCSLEELFFSNCAQFDSSLFDRDSPQWPRLRLLTIPFCTFSRHGEGSENFLPSLKTLTLSSCDITKAGFWHSALAAGCFRSLRDVCIDPFRGKSPQWRSLLGPICEKRRIELDVYEGRDDTMSVTSS